MKGRESKWYSTKIKLNFNKSVKWESRNVKNRHTEKRAKWEKQILPYQ